MITKHKDGIIINPTIHDWKLLKEIEEEKCFDKEDYYIRHALNSIPIAVTQLLLNLNKRIEELEYEVKDLKEK